MRSMYGYYVQELQVYVIFPGIGSTFRININAERQYHKFRGTKQQQERQQHSDANERSRVC